ncbi:MAG: 16S rRNA (uracil(1498)-N(3))-methyltransferase [Muribaculaceae bacterium]
MNQFYAPEILTTLQLPEVESQHCVRVLRLGAGDKIEVIDGCGTRYICNITLAHPKRCQVEIIESHSIPNHWKCNLSIGIAPTKNIDRIEWMAEKVTETGVDAIIPLRCRYSERKELKIERINKILISAMKQSLKTTLPRLDEMTPFNDLITAKFDGQKFIAYCDKEIERRSFVHEYIKGENALIIIGPEGDFSKDEIRLALDNGFIPVSLGESRFRTETAAVFACAAFHVINQL